jgi:hypothetical protein
VIVALRRLADDRRRNRVLSGMALSPVSAVLARVGLGKLSRLEPPEPPNRYQRRHAGEPKTRAERARSGRSARR